MTHDCSNILGRKPLRTGVIERVSFVCQEAKRNADEYFETIGERADLALHTGVVVKCVSIKITKFRGIPFQSKVSKRDGNIGLYQSDFLEGD